MMNINPWHPFLGARRTRFALQITPFLLVIGAAFVTSHFWGSMASPAKNKAASQPNARKSVVKPGAGKAVLPPVVPSISADLELTLVKKGVLVGRGIGLKGVKLERQSANSFIPTIAFASDTNREVGTINLIKSVNGAQILSTWRLKEPFDVASKSKNEDDDDDWSVFINPVIISVSPRARYILFYIDDGESGFTSPKYVLDTQLNVLTELPIKPFKFERVAWSSDEKQMAYIRGGSGSGSLEDSVEGQYEYAGPLSLNVYNFQTKKTGKVMESDSLNGAFWWTSERSLIYGAVPNLKGTGISKEFLKPNVYEYSTTTRTSRLILQAAYNPKPSPDGKYVAFCGSPNPNFPVPLLEKSPEDDRLLPWRDLAGGSYLCVENLATHKRVAFKPYYGSYPTVLWLPDGKSFVSMDVIYSNNNKITNVNFYVRDVEDQSIRGPFTFKSLEIYSRFSFIKASVEGDSIYFYETYPRIDKKNNVTSILRINKMNIHSGDVTLETEFSGTDNVSLVST